MKKILLILFLLFTIIMYGMALTYTSQYPTAHSDDYVKATSKHSTGYWPYYATDPALPLTGDQANNQWYSHWDGAITDQRFHIDLGSAKIIRRIYYENAHNEGIHTNIGVQNFTFWGSNTEASFLELTYATDTGWTQLATSISVWEEHILSDESDPQYATVTNTTAYRYYAFKFADNYGHTGYMGVRHTELQTEDGYGEVEDNAIWFGICF